MKRFFVFYLPALIWAAVIFSLSHIPYIQTPDLGFNVTDKMAHFGVYAILGYLVIRAMTLNQPARMTWRNLLLAGIIAMLYAASDEVHQMFVPGRVAEIGDFIADSSGVICAIVVFWLMSKLLEAMKVRFRNN
ncbi:VanZ family protein [candidate division KSB1 bacterium]|nr:VanZ family protein [candidate division KSB1 bacterium]